MIVAVVERGRQDEDTTTITDMSERVRRRWTLADTEAEIALEG